MRAKEIDKLIDHIRRHESVRLVGGLEFGRTSVLNELDRALCALGFSVIRLTGDAGISSVKYAALRECFHPGERFTANAAPNEVRDLLAMELSRTPNTVVLIDDAEFLDRASAHALAPLFERNFVSGVFASVPFQRLTPEQRAVSHILRANARVELPPLSFEQVGVLAERILQKPASPEIIAQVFSMSSGITGIAADILRAVETTGQIQISSGRWVAAERRLWNQHLEESAERLLAPLDEEPLRLLHGLSLAGSLPTGQFHAFDPASASALDRHGLVTSFIAPHGQSRISPSPTLITDYFRQRPIDLPHIASVQLLGDLANVANEEPQRIDLPEHRFDAQVRHQDAEATHNAGLARFLREQTEQQLTSSSREWRRHQDAPHAIAYLDALLQSGRYVSTAVEVLERTSPERASGAELLQLALHERILQREAVAPQTVHSQMLRKQHPSMAVALEAYDTYQWFCDEGRDDRVERWLSTHGDDPIGFCETIAAYIRTSSGEFLREEDIRVPQSPLPFQRLIDQETRVLALARQAASEDALEPMLLDPLTLSSGDNTAQFLLNSYVRSLVFLNLGRVTEARRTLSQALSVGDLDLRHAVLYAAMLRWSAFLHHRDGRADTARSLLAESANYAALRGPMPGMRPEFGDALEVLLAGDRRAAGARFLREANDCLDRSFLDACWTTARFAFQLDPGEKALDLLRRLSLHPAYKGALPLAEFGQAAMRQDPSIILHISRFRGLTELATAADFLEDVEFANRELGRTPSPEYARASAEAHESFKMFREPPNRVNFRLPPLAVDSLTPREREIAPLTATLSNREIAGRLTLSVRTVENHVARSMKKLGLSSRNELSTALTSLGKSSAALTRGAESTQA